MRSEGWASVNGTVTPISEAKVSVLDAGFTLGWTVFETLIGRNGAPLRLDRHLKRLEGSCHELAIACPDLPRLAAQVEDVAGRVGGDVRIRITVSGSGSCVVVGTVLDAGRRHREIRAVRGIWREDPYLPGSSKHGSRASWVVGLRKAKADEMLLVDSNKRFVEGTTSAVLAVIDGVLWTHPHDGRVLESTACTQIVQDAGALGIEVRHEAPPAYHRWDGLYIASVSRHIAPVVSLDGEALPGWDPVGRALASYRSE